MDCGQSAKKGRKNVAVNARGARIQEVMKTELGSQDGLKRLLCEFRGSGKASAPPKKIARNPLALAGKTR